MNKFLKRLNRRKGFTLVECLIAVAVFAAMVMVVFMILTNARAAANTAIKTEEDLTQLINNVVSDETYRKYKDEYDASGNRMNVLSLNIQGSSDTFDISYNVIDGYKNFVVCPTCGHFANNSDFMGTTKVQDFSQSSAYVCPADSSHTFYQTLQCEDCLATGTHDDTSLFTYEPASGSYGCNSCGGMAVKGTDIEEVVTSDARLSVSGLVPNAIIYGDVDQPASNSTLVTFSGTNSTTGATMIVDSGDGAVNVNLQYTAAVNQTLPGTYTLTITPTVPLDMDSSNFSVELRLPAHYAFRNFKELTTSGTCTYVSGGATDDNAYIKYNFTTAAQYKVQFQLVNYKSGFSFEYDYNNASNNSLQGLAGYWFGLSVSSPTRDASGYIVQLNASGTISN